MTPAETRIVGEMTAVQIVERLLEAALDSTEQIRDDAIRLEFYDAIDTCLKVAEQAQQMLTLRVGEEVADGQ